MSQLTSSLAFGEINEQILESELDLLIKARHLSISNVLTELEPIRQVVKVSGNITISF